MCFSLGRPPYTCSHQKFHSKIPYLSLYGWSLFLCVWIRSSCQIQILLTFSSQVSGLYLLAPFLYHQFWNTLWAGFYCLSAKIAPLKISNNWLLGWIQWGWFFFTPFSPLNGSLPPASWYYMNLLLLRPLTGPLSFGAADLVTSASCVEMWPLLSKGESPVLPLPFHSGSGFYLRLNVTSSLVLTSSPCPRGAFLFA